MFVILKHSRWYKMCVLVSCFYVGWPALYLNKIFHFFLFRDRLTKNDVVGTTYLSLSKIASSGGEIEGNWAVHNIIFSCVGRNSKVQCCKKVYFPIVPQFCGNKIISFWNFQNNAPRKYTVELFKVKYWNFPSSWKQQ